MVANNNNAGHVSKQWRGALTARVRMCTARHRKCSRRTRVPQENIKLHVNVASRGGHSQWKDTVRGRGSSTECLAAEDVRPKKHANDRN
eukprot:556625-Pelagomonas_calceolata.AAC.1